MLNMSCRCVPILAVIGFVLTPLTAQAQLLTYAGRDNAAGPTDSRPHSNAAAALFDAAADPHSTLTFESSSTGNFTSLTPVSGVTITHSNNTAAIATGGTVIVGYNTTSGGTKYLSLTASNTAITTESLTFSFTTPIQAFGAYITGLGTTNFGTSTLEFNDGSTQSLTVTGGTAGGVQFFGFTDAGASISSVKFVIDRPAKDITDAVGFDDVRYQPTAVPEPSPLILLAGIGASGLGLLYRRKRIVTARSSSSSSSIFNPT